MNLEIMQKWTLEWQNIVVNFQKWKHQMKRHTSKCLFIFTFQVIHYFHSFTFRICQVLLKGVQCAEDAVMAFKDFRWTASIIHHPPFRWVGASDCAQAGLAGCVLSNHGGRQLDTCRPGIEVGKWVTFDEVNRWGFTDAWCLDERSWQVFRRLRRFEWMWIVSNQALQLEVLPEVMEALKEAGATKVRRDCWGRKWLFLRFWIGLLLKLVFCLDFSCMFESKQGISFPKLVGWCPTLPTTACTRRPLLCSSMAVCVVVATSLKQWHWEHRPATQFQLARVAGRAIAWVGRLGRDFYTTVACCRVCMITIDNSW